MNSVSGAPRGSCVFERGLFPVCVRAHTYVYTYSCVCAFTLCCVGVGVFFQVQVLVLSRCAARKPRMIDPLLNRLLCSQNCVPKTISR